jgi:hypothetical protein
MARSAGVPGPVPLLLELAQGPLRYALSGGCADGVWSELPWRRKASATARIGAGVRGLTKKRWVRLGVA